MKQEKTRERQVQGALLLAQGRWCRLARKVTPRVPHGKNTTGSTNIGAWPPLGTVFVSQSAPPDLNAASHALE